MYETITPNKPNPARRITNWLNSPRVIPALQFMAVGSFGHQAIRAAIAGDYGAAALTIPVIALLATVAVQAIRRLDVRARTTG